MIPGDNGLIFSAEAFWNARSGRVLAEEEEADFVWLGPGGRVRVRFDGRRWGWAVGIGRGCGSSMRSEV